MRRNALRIERSRCNALRIERSRESEKSINEKRSANDRRIEPMGYVTVLLRWFNLDARYLSGRHRFIQTKANTDDNTCRMSHVV